MIDNLLIDQIEQQTIDKNVAVLLSGGVDSLSVAFAAHRMGKKITAYTFHLEGNRTYDAMKAAEVSKLMGWDCHTVVVPTFNLVKDFQRLVKEVRCKKKTHFECCFPFFVSSLFLRVVAAYSLALKAFIAFSGRYLSPVLEDFLPLLVRHFCFVQDFKDF